MPTITINAPNKKLNKILGVMGAIVKLSTNTIAITGSTAFNASSNFSVSFRFQNLKSLPLVLFFYTSQSWVHTYIYILMQFLIIV